MSPSDALRHEPDLVAKAARVRQHVVRMASRGGCYLGSALSCADLLVYLHARLLRDGGPDAGAVDRDYLLLSKGHAVPALYGALVEQGRLDVEILDAHLDGSGGVYWHPNPELPGVEVHSGSLGHLPAVGLGIALDLKMRGGAGRVFVLMGDGELNEGSVWETFLVASALRAGNLVTIVDRNLIQANRRTEELVPLEPLELKLISAGFSVTHCDGHSFADMDRAFTRVGRSEGRPVAIIAHTVRGRGLERYEDRVDGWFVELSASEARECVEELARGEGAAT